MSDRNRHWLQLYVDEHLSSGKSNRDPDGYFHASIIANNLGQQCDRYLAYTLFVKREGDKIDAKTQRIFRVGDDLHLSLQKMFDEMGILIKYDQSEDGSENRSYEVFYSIDYPPVRGNADGHIVRPHTEENYLLELKSIHTMAFQKTIAPVRSHQIQLNIYMGGIGIHKGVFIYEDKNNQDQKYFDYEFNKEEWDELVIRLKGIYDKYLNRVLPERIDIPGCKGCGFYNVCKGRNVARDKSTGEYLPESNFISTELYPSLPNHRTERE
jgi:CRISPR/Cas system-associated exonuclease Cas4 (RecB family)